MLGMADPTSRSRSAVTVLAVQNGVERRPRGQLVSGDARRAPSG